MDPNDLDLASFEAEANEISKLIEKTKTLQSHLQSHTYNPSKSPFTSPFPHRTRQNQGSPPLPPSTSFIHPLPMELPARVSRNDEFEELQKKYEPKIESKAIPEEQERYQKYRSNWISSDGEDKGVVLEKFQMAKHYYEHGDFTKALDCYSQCLAHYRRARVRNYVFQCNILLGMGNCYYRQGNYSSAQELYDRVDVTLQKQQRTGGTVSSKKQVLKTYGRITPFVNLGLVFYQEGNYDEALSYFLKALQCAENVIGIDRLVLSDIYHNIGVVFDEQGNIVGALKMYKKSVRIREKVLGKRHLLTALTYENIAQIFKDLKKFKEAIKMQKQVIDIRKSLLGTNTVEYTLGMHKMGLILYEYGAITKAIFYIEKAYKGRSKLLGENHRLTRESYRARNMILRSKKKKKK